MKCLPSFHSKILYVVYDPLILNFRVWASEKGVRFFSPASKLADSSHKNWGVSKTLGRGQFFSFLLFFISFISVFLNLNADFSICVSSESLIPISSKWHLNRMQWRSHFKNNPRDTSSKSRVQKLRKFHY